MKVTLLSVWYVGNRVKKLQKQTDKLQLQLTEARAVARDLRNQLNEADEFKVCGKIIS